GNHGGEASLVVNGHVGQNLAVKLDGSLLGACDELAVAQAQLAAGGVDTSDPKCAECALFVATVAVGILPSLHDRLFGDTEYITPAAAIAFGCLEDFFVTGTGGNTAFYAWHGKKSPLIKRRASSPGP